MSDDEKLLAFAERHGFEGVMYGTRTYRKCTCGKPTVAITEEKCGKCGGRRQAQVFNQCQVEGCARQAHKANGTLCRECWVKEDPETRGCPRCKTEPKNLSREDKRCGNCAKRKTDVLFVAASKRAAERASALQLILEANRCNDEEFPADEGDATLPFKGYTAMSQSTGFVVKVTVDGETKTMSVKTEEDAKALASGWLRQAARAKRQKREAEDRAILANIATLPTPPPDPGKGKRSKTPQRYMTPLGSRLWDGCAFRCAHDEQQYQCVAKRKEAACPPFAFDAIENRYDDVVALATKVNARLVIDNAEEWKRSYKGWHTSVELICLAHPNEPPITSTNLNNLKAGKLNCPKCRHKTEAKLFGWLQQHLPGARHNAHKLQNPKTGGQMSVDFDDPALHLVIELDGFHHFVEGINKFGAIGTTPERDLEKERQLLAKGYQVLRVLQEDVWEDKNGWENWLLGEIARWRVRHKAGKSAEAARHPDAPEYLGGVYARLRGKGVEDPDDVCPVGTTTSPDPEVNFLAAFLQGEYIP